MTQKFDLITAIQFAYDETLAFAGKLAEAELSTAGLVDHWTAHDVLAHLADSNRQMAETLAAGSRGEEPPVGRSNDEVYHRYKDQPGENILTEIRQARQLLFEQIDALSEAELNSRVDWLNGRPIWRAIAGTAIVHQISHLAQALIERGEPEQAIQLDQRAYEIAVRLDDSSDWRGLFPYNTACLYALIGNKPMALQNLKTSYKMSPRLVELSKQDTDLVSLHGDADFLALIEQFSAPEQASGN
jgi:tetratricopeptide (TPR) repeat protein